MTDLGMRMRRRLGVALIWLLGLLAPSIAAAENIALVIGVSNYQNVATLANPANDARAVGDAFRALGYRTRVELDLGNAQMQQAFGQFALEAQSAEIAVVYYAGHGIEVGGTNYLIPSDAQLQDASQIGFQATSVDAAVEAASGARSLSLVILDACRNNPFAQKMRSRGATRSIGNGLSRPNPRSVNTLIAYAAQAGAVAADGMGSNSPFTTALLSELRDPNRDIRLFFGAVGEEVRALTGGAQSPSIYGTMGRSRIGLTGLLDGGTRPSAPQTAPAAPTDPCAGVQLSQGMQCTVDAYGRAQIAMNSPAPAPTPYAAPTPAPYVVPSGNVAGELIVDANGGSQYRTIQSAVSAAAAGATIKIRPGTYTGMIEVYETVNLIGDGPREQIILDSRNSKPAIAWVAPSGTVSGLTIRQTGMPVSSMAIGRGSLTLSNNDISGNSKMQLAISENARTTITGNRIHGAQMSGIVFTNASGVVRGNEIFDNQGAGITILNGGRPEISENKFYRNKLTGVVVDASRVVLSKNHFSLNGIGLKVVKAGYALATGNTFENNQLVGVSVGEGGAGKYIGNTFVGNPDTLHRHPAAGAVEESRSIIIQ